MDNGWAVVLGGAVGVVGSRGTAYLNHRLSLTNRNRAEEAAKDLLRTVLSRPRWKWARIEALANAAGGDEPTVRRLLLEIGARGSLIDGRVWGLVARNPITDRATDTGTDGVILGLAPEPPIAPEEEAVEF